jgi:methyl-accepting chemotaxis protein
MAKSIRIKIRLSSRRHRIWVDPIQHRLMITYLAHFLAIVLAFVSVLFVPLIVELYTETQHFAMRQETANDFLALHKRLWPAVAVLMAFLAVHSVVVLHRIGGPLYRIKKAMRTIAIGDLSQILRLRRNDYLHNEAHAFNEMQAGLANKIGELHQRRRSLHAALELARNLAETPSDPNPQKGLALIEAEIRMLDDDLSWFKLPPESYAEGKDSLASFAAAEQTAQPVDH